MSEKQKIRCLYRDCNSETEDKSNYCENHKWTPSYGLRAFASKVDPEEQIKPPEQIRPKIEPLLFNEVEISQLNPKLLDQCEGNYKLDSDSSVFINVIRKSNKIRINIKPESARLAFSVRTNSKPFAEFKLDANGHIVLVIDKLGSKLTAKKIK